MKKFLPLLALCLFSLLITAGCNKSNAVKLTYAIGEMPLTPCVGEITVFKFEDKRSSSKLGQDNNGVAINSLSDVADWVGWAFFDELKSIGCDAKYRTSTVTPGDGALIIGEVLDVALNQTGTTTYAGKVTVKITVTKGGQTLLSEKYTSQVEDVVLPGYGTESDIMAEALRGVTAEAIPSIAKAL